MRPRRLVPGLLHPLADELQESGAAPNLDEEPRDRIALAVEAHQVLRILLDPEQARERHVAAPGEQGLDDLIVPLLLALVLAQEGGPLVGPARHGAAE